MVGAQRIRLLGESVAIEKYTHLAICHGQPMKYRDSFGEVWSL